MRKFGLIGYPIGHSFSPGYFAEKFVKYGIKDAQYEAYNLETLVNLQDFAAKENLSGFNVTIPHKQAIIPLLDRLSIPASEINAVNCVKLENGKWVAYNTDYIGFKMTLASVVKNKDKALIFGSGGSSLAVRYALHILGIDYKIVSRNSNNGIGYGDVTANLIEEHKILINTTPLGMSPNTEFCVDIPYKIISPYHICYDLIYNPEETLFLKKAKMRGAIVKNGM